MTKFTWDRYKGYEVSSRGDSRFSAFYAKLKDGRSIEEIYQLDIKGYREISNDLMIGKGVPPYVKISKSNLYEAYLDAWRQWADQNPKLIKELKSKAESNGNRLSDRFANSDCNQARALCDILNERFGDEMSEDNNSRIYVNKKGQPVERVSNIIKQLNKDGLIEWANFLGFKRVSYKKELERTARIGTMAHDVIDKYLDPKQIAVHDYKRYGLYDHQDQTEARNCIKSFTKWYRKNRDWFKVKHRELTVVGSSFGGTIDCIIESPYTKGHVVICDFKTSKQFTLTHFLQLVAYVILYEDEYNEIVDAVTVIRMNKKDGTIAETKTLMRKEFSVYMKIFSNLLEITNLIKSIN